MAYRKTKPFPPVRLFRWIGSRLRQWIFRREATRLLDKLAKEGRLNFLKGYKTVIFNVLTIAAAVFAAPAVAEIIPPESLVIVVGVVNLLLRFVTTSPVFRSPPGPLSPP